MLDRARPFFTPLFLISFSAALLAQNFHLLPTDWRLAPVVLILIGINFLLRRNASAHSRSHPIDSDRYFRITKADSISASLVIDSGLEDLWLDATTDKTPIGTTDETATLISGQYTITAPPIQRHFQHATIQLNRRPFVFLNVSDWRLNLAPELPWQLEIRSWLGDHWLDCSALWLEGATCSNVFGTLRFTPPARATSPLTLHNALGDIYIQIPPDRSCRVRIHRNRYTRVHANDLRYVLLEDDSYAAGSLAESARPVLLEIYPGLGDVFLE